MKKDVTETIVIYDNKGKAIKEVDVTGLPWKLQYSKALWALQTSFYGDSWTIITKPKPK